MSPTHVCLSYLCFPTFRTEHAKERSPGNAPSKNDLRNTGLCDRVDGHRRHDSVLEYRAEKIKGYKEHEILGQNFRIFYLPQDRQAGLPEQLIDLAKKEGRARHIGRRVRKDGTLFWGSILITALHDDNGEVIGFTKLTRELSDHETF